jgi:nucleoid-associated protein YgaU
VAKIEPPPPASVQPSAAPSSSAQTDAGANQPQVAAPQSGDIGKPAPATAEKQAAAEPPRIAQPPPANAVVSEVHIDKVVRGDSLWAISRRFYGHGVRFGEIFEANASQIRDPRLIYPGQIFVVPDDSATP